MNPIIQDIEQGYRNLIDRWDRDLDPADPNIYQRRLQRSHLMLIMNGDFGKIALHRLLEQPVNRLLVFPVTAEDAAYLKTLRSSLNTPINQAILLDTPIEASNSSLIVAKHHLVIAALGRPFPDLADEVNRICVNTDTAWIHAHTWGAKFTMGPLVLPGITACYECYRRRLDANSLQQDVDQAVDHFLRADAQFAFNGQHGVINNMLASYLVAEVSRFLTRRKMPTTLSQEMITMPIYYGSIPAYNFITPLEWCPICWHKQTQHAHPDVYDLASVVEAVSHRQEVNHAVRQ